MSENITNADIENVNDETKSAIYSSSFVMDKELFYDFSSVSYNRTKKIILVFLCFAIFVCLEVIIVGNVGNYDIVIAYSLAISFIMFVTYFNTARTIDKNYKRNLISFGKDPEAKEELFEDKIISSAEGAKREFFYHQVTKFFETKQFILLHLQYHMYIAINKNTLNADIDEVKAFLVEKCALVKKRKFMNCANDRKISLVLLIALIVFSVAASVVNLILKTHNIQILR